MTQKCAYCFIVLLLYLQGLIIFKEICMNNIFKHCLIASTICFGLSAPTFACGLITESLEETGKLVHSVFFGGTPWVPDYLVTDSKEECCKSYLDGIPQGTKFDDSSYIKKDFSVFYGDKLTDLHTKKTGTITGVHDEGTMDVVTPKGNYMRYEYVTFKVKK